MASSIVAGRGPPRCKERQARFDPNADARRRAGAGSGVPGVGHRRSTPLTLYQLYKQ
jgi:hypothetical protein